MATRCSFHLSKLTDSFVQHLSTMAYQVLLRIASIFRLFVKIVILGKGSIFSLAIVDGAQIQLLNQLQWEDGIFDIAWSENEPNVIVGASGDGSLQLWNLDQVIYNLTWNQL